MEKKQATKLEMIQRENRIMDLIQKSISPAEICEMLSVEFSVSERTIERDYYRVVASLGSISQERKRDLRAQLIARQDSLYNKAIEEGDHELALKVTMSMAKVGGLFDTAKEQDPALPTLIEFKPKVVAGNGTE